MNSGQPLDNFEVLLRRRMVSASDRALRPFEPSAIARKAASGSVARPAAKPARRTGWYVLLAAMLVLTALLFAAGSGAFRNLIVGPVGPSPSPYSSVAPSLAPSHAVVSASPSASASIAGADHLILFGVSVSVNSGATGTYCTMFYTIHPDGSGERQLPADLPALWQRLLGPHGRQHHLRQHAPRQHFHRDLRRRRRWSIADRTADAVGWFHAGVLARWFPDGLRRSRISTRRERHLHRRRRRHAPAPTDEPPKRRGRDLQPRFSPDGSRLVFWRLTNHPVGTASGDELWIVNADGTDLHRLTAALAVSMFAQWSPDGSHLLFSGTQTVGTDVGLWTIDADGTGLTPIVTGTGGRDENADWSPDGSRIVYNHLEPATGVRSLRLMNADGSGVTTLSYPINAGRNNNIVGPDWGTPR